MSFQQVYKIARREYLARVRNKAFVIMTLLLPGGMALYMVALQVIFSGTGVDNLKVAVLDTGTGLAADLGERLEAIRSPNIEISEVTTIPGDDEASRQSYSDQVVKENLDGYIVLAADPEIVATARYYARETGNPILMSRIERAVQATSLNRMLSGSGVDVDRVSRLQRWDLESFTVSSEGEKGGGFATAFFSTFVFAMILYMAVLINGQGMAMAIVEEKASRLIEVVLGAVTAAEFMAGKVIGVLASGLTQLAVWVGFSLGATLYVLPALSINTQDMGFDLVEILNFRLIFYFAIFLTLGYMLYSTLFAIVAATCTSTEELSQSMFPAMLPIIIALISTFYVAANPSTMVSKILSLIPFFTPLVMLARINVLMPPLWEVWLSILLLLATSLGAAWFAAKVLRFALLMHGKRPKLSDILRMARAS